MKYAIRIGLSIVLSAIMLSGCMGLSGAWTGASLIYDRHHFYKKFNDYELVALSQHAIFHDHRLSTQGVTIEIAAFNGDLLIAGHVPTVALREIIMARLAEKKLHYRHFFNQIAVKSSSTRDLEDAWITTQIRSRMMADAMIDPNQFKVITVDGIVYLMGDTLPEDAHRVIRIARQTDNVVRVVTLFQYYQYQSVTH